MSIGTYLYYLLHNLLKTYIFVMISILTIFLRFGFDDDLSNIFVIIMCSVDHTCSDHLLMR